MAEEAGEIEEAKPKKKKHTPGRGHRRKSDPSKKERFRRKCAKEREKELAARREKWKIWEALRPDQQKILQDLKPDFPRPTDED